MQAWADNDTDKNLIRAIFPAPLDLDRRRFSKLHLSVLGIHHAAIDALLLSDPALLLSDPALLLSDPALLDAQDRHGRAAAHWAAWKGDVSTLTKLLSHGASPNLADTRGPTPLHYACMTGLAACTAALVAAGADLNSADHLGITPLLGLPLGTCRADALTAGGLTPLETLRQRGRVTKELIEVFGALLVKAGWGARGVVLSGFLGTEDESESEAGSEGDVFVLADEGADV
ncbi:ankyrin repeat-containing domain protein [Lasiosphaeria miniovina]|uniref:Ankyrin repeat-containing domain protein n=1 Tax=Lasiosphaeria miniovina TaxID=1954250 RepID=A0AA40ADY7_9PEZI|nr:ankyrin repeat-containing domain protein [Lasiosphaeria miniovina]KAK0714032.1 ankyrin repeat-containing domain protein [Lasiosphaeria miniovina]